eukprot:1185002-Prorocentrum_minimum.AAC.1
MPKSGDFAIFLNSTSLTLNSPSLTPNSLDRFLQVGGGPMPKSGDFVGMSLVVKVNDEVLLDTKATKRPIAFTFGKKPYVSLVCGGLEEGLSTMRRGGVREIIIPPELAYGEMGKVLPNLKQVPPGATVVITASLEDVTGSYL